MGTQAILDASVMITQTLVSQGWATQGIVTVTGNYTPLPSDAVILVNATGGPVTITLADATQAPYVTGQRYTVIKTDSSGNAVTITGSTGQTVAGSAVTLTNGNAYAGVVFDGANWQVWSGLTVAGGGPPGGSAGGDLAGTYPNPSVKTKTDWLNVVTQYGADPTGSTDSTTAFVNAIAALGTNGGVVYVPAGSYKANTGQIPVATGLHLIGDGYQSTTISGTAGGAYLFNTDPPGYTSTHVEDLLITGLTLNCTGMDIFWGSNLVRSKIVGNQLIQNSPGNAVFNVQATTGSTHIGYMAECEFSNKEMIGGNPRTIEAWHLDFSFAGSQACNDCVWHGGGSKIWSSLNGDASMYWLKLIGAASGAFGSRHNIWRDLIFELSGGATGGLIHLQNLTNAYIYSLSSEDLGSGTVGNPMILLDTNGSPGGCQNVVIRDYSRRGGNNISSTVPDIKLDANANTVAIDSPSRASGGTAVTIDLAAAPHVALTGVWPSSYTILNPPTSKYAAPPAPAVAFTPGGGNTTSTSLVMAGLGTTAATTANGTGQMLTIITGACYTQTAATTMTVGARFGPLAGPATTVAAGSNGVAANSFTGSQALSVAATTGYAATGTVWVATSTTPAQISYTGVSGATLTGCTYVNGGTGTLSTGGSVTAYPQAGSPAAGTTIGADQTIRPAGTAAGVGFSVQSVITFTPGVKNWLDIAFATGNASDTAQLSNTQFTVIEQANS